MLARLRLLGLLSPAIPCPHHPSPHPSPPLPLPPQLTTPTQANFQPQRTRAMLRRARRNPAPPTQRPTNPNVEHCRWSIRRQRPRII